MSRISEAATISILLADFANMDGGKIYALGVGGNVLPLNPNGLTTRFSLITHIHAPAEVCPTETALEISLRNADDDIVELAGPVPQKIRYAVVITISAEPVKVPLTQSNFIGALSTNLLDFSNGLPLAPGNYSWHATLDGDEEHFSEFRFCVPLATVDPVVG